MQAVMKVAPGVGNVELREIAEPLPPAAHVLIEVRAAGICGTDLHIYHDEFRTRPPVVIGHEVAGTVAPRSRSWYSMPRSGGRRWDAAQEHPPISTAIAVARRPVRDAVGDGIGEGAAVRGKEGSVRLPLVISEIQKSRA